MMQWSCERYPDIPRSLEIEKPRRAIEDLFGFAGVLLFSRAYAVSRGYADPAALLRSIHRQFPAADLFCTLGEDGAVCLDRQGCFTHQAVGGSQRVVDTLGAGDTFNAGVIDGYLARRNAATVLRQACALAEEKCGRRGLDGLVGDSPQGA